MAAYCLLVRAALATAHGTFLRIATSGLQLADALIGNVCACLGAAGSHQVEHFAAELLGVTLRHGHGSFDGRRDQKSSKPTPL
ncbi:conserved hypothetical protein [Mycobacterium tuberculosis]|nr:conserved hypothetical protein [Mycobacterium tuberculosis]